MLNILTINFSAMAKPLKEQLEDQGLRCDLIDKYQLLYKSILALWFHSYIPDSQKNKLAENFPLPYLVGGSFSLRYCFT